jgi:hypothetical protein
MFTPDREQMRKFYRDAWRKHTDGLPMEPLEALVSAVIAMHPEYHQLLDNEDADLDKDYLPEAGQTNPFLHMGMHIALNEQISTDRPPGITNLYKQLLIKNPDQHETQHSMMECLGEALWQSQQDGLPPNDMNYFNCLKKLLKRSR